MSAADTRIDGPGLESAVAKALIRLMERDVADGEAPRRCYLSAYLPSHVAAGGLWTGLAAASDVLLACDPAAIAVEVQRDGRRRAELPADVRAVSTGSRASMQAQIFRLDDSSLETFAP